MSPKLQPKPPRDLVRHLEVERMFAELVDAGVSRDVIGAQRHDDEYSGHARYFPPFTTSEVDGERTTYGPTTATAWAEAWRDWHLRPFWNPPERAAVQEALADRAAAITELASQLLPRLSPAEAEVYRLHFVAGHSVRAIAHRTQRHMGTVTKLLARLKAKARAIAAGGTHR
jgi:hypothetical protein